MWYFILDTTRSMLLHYTVHKWSPIGDWNSVHGLHIFYVNPSKPELAKFYDLNSLLIEWAKKCARWKKMKEYNAIWESPKENLLLLNEYKFFNLNLKSGLRDNKQNVLTWFIGCYHSYWYGWLGFLSNVQWFNELR